MNATKNTNRKFSQSYQIKWLARRSRPNLGNTERARQPPRITARACKHNRTDTNRMPPADWLHSCPSQAQPRLAPAFLRRLAPIAEKPHRYEQNQFKFFLEVLLIQFFSSTKNNFFHPQKIIFLTDDWAASVTAGGARAGGAVE